MVADADIVRIYAERTGPSIPPIKLALDFYADTSVHAVVADPRDLAEVILPRLSSLLEQALELASSSRAVEMLPKVARLCEDASVVAKAGGILIAPDP